MWSEPFPYQRSWVFKPSLRRMMTSWYWKFESLAGGVGNGPPPTSDCQPSTRPMFWLVLPSAVMPLTRFFMFVQL